MCFLHASPCADVVFYKIRLTKFAMPRLNHRLMRCGAVPMLGVCGLLSQEKFRSCHWHKQIFLSSFNVLMKDWHVQKLRYSLCGPSDMLEINLCMRTCLCILKLFWRWWWGSLMISSGSRLSNLLVGLMWSCLCAVRVFYDLCIRFLYPDSIRIICPLHRHQCNVGYWSLDPLMYFFLDFLSSINLSIDFNKKKKLSKEKN